MSTIPLALSPQKQPYFTVTNLAVPCEGPRVQPLLLDFSVGPFYSIDLQNTQALKQFSMVQAVFIDNKDNANSITIANQITGQAITIGANKQAYLNILCPNPAQLTFQSNGGVVVKVDLLNFPVTNCVWSTL